MAGNEVRFDVVASDKASKILDGVADKAETVETADPTVDIGADAGDADRTIAGLGDHLAKLTTADQIVVMSLRAGGMQSELTDLALKLADIDADDPNVAVTFDRYATVAGQLDDIEQQIKAIGDADPDAGKSIEKANDRLRDMGDEAGKAKDAVHSMAGNAVGDFAATATGIGPLGEAVGQLVEGIGAGEVGFHNLVSAGLGLGAISAGMLVLNKVMGQFADASKRAAEIRAFRTAEVDAFTASLRNGTDAAQALIDKVAQSGTFEGLFRGAGTAAAQWGSQVKTDLIGPLAEAGVTVEQFAKVVTGTDADVTRFADALGAANVSTDAQRVLVGAATSAHEDYGKALDRSAAFSKAFADDTDGATGSLMLENKASFDARSNAAALDRATQAAAHTQRDMDAAARHTADGLQYQSDKLDALRGNVSNDQAWIDLETSFDNVRDSAKTAFDAAKKGAEDASAKVRQHESDTNALKLAIIQYGTEVLKLPPDVVTNVVTHVNDSELDALERRLETIKRNAVINAQIIDRGGAGYGPSGTPRSVPAGATIANYYLAAPVAAREVARVQGRRARINGR